jgi:electron transfer flavoprotein alpha subunit/NAD-dependent dihydropyrimidine dehydrogenase PreA subunit
MIHLRIIEEKCTGCGKCMIACPLNEIYIKEKTAVVGKGCNFCGSCLNVCEAGAIVIEGGESKGTEDKEHYKGVFVLAEHYDSKPKEVALELLGKGRELADELREELSAILIGHQVSHISKTLIHYGADKVYIIDRTDLKHYQTELYTAAISSIIAKYKPAIFLFGATTTGRDLAPRVAVRMRTGLTADCTGLDIEKDTRLLLQTRPTWGGNLIATIKCANHRPQMATVRSRVMNKLPLDSSRQGEIVNVDATINAKSARTKLLELIKSEEESHDISEADIVVAAGRGIQKANNLVMIKHLAGALGASIGASRPLVDAGWIEHSHQIGQTGKTIRPKLYVACGISGALQHVVGMQDSDLIIAINTDPTAPIFDVADFGIVGDLFQVIPNFIAELRK